MLRGGTIVATTMLGRVLLTAVILGAASSADAPAVGVLVARGAGTHERLPAIGEVGVVLADLEVAAPELPRVVDLDVNGDGAADWLVEAAEPLCGTGGCPYALVDGRSGRRLGDFFGSPLVVRERRHNGLPVVEAFQHLGAGSGALVTYEFDGTTCRPAARTALDESAIAVLLARWRELPAAGPRR